MRKKVFFVLFVILPFFAFADDKGTCGDNTTWVYTQSTKTLTISGEGWINGYPLPWRAPWYDYRTEIQKIVIEPGITTIGKRTFLFLEKVESVDFPNTVVSIEEQAFADCKSLTYFKAPSNLTTIHDDAFKGCENLETIEFDDNLITIGKNAFWGCKKLQSIRFPNNVTSIGKNAFRECESMSSIYISSSIESIASDAFYGCCALNSIVVDGNNPYYDSRDNCNALIKTASNTLIVGSNNTKVIPDGVSSINWYAFMGLKNLDSILIPNSVINIGSYAFQNCSNLKSVTIPEGNIGIYQSTFQGCGSLESVVIPSSISYIHENAFRGCINLNSVYISDLSAWCRINFEGNSISFGSNPLYYAQHLYVDGEEVNDLIIPSDIASVLDYAFDHYKGLTSVTFNENISSIGDNAFAGCVNLTSLTIPNTIKSIGINAFSGCSGIKSIILGSGIELIKSAAFSQCSALEDVFCYAEGTLSTSVNAFDDSHVENTTLHIPVNDINYYNSKIPWMNFKNIVALTDYDPIPTTSINRLYLHNINQYEIYYNPMGQKIIHPHKGIYITNGKKFLIK